MNRTQGTPLNVLSNDVLSMCIISLNTQMTNHFIISVIDNTNRNHFMLLVCVFADFYDKIESAYRGQLSYYRISVGPVPPLFFG